MPIVILHTIGTQPQETSKSADKRNLTKRQCIRFLPLQRFQHIARAMAVSVNAIFLLVLLSSCMPEIQASVHYGYQTDPTLDKIATEVVADVIQELKSFAENKDATKGLPSAPPIDTKFTIAGIEFQLQALSGVFRGFPSLTIAGETKLNYRLQNRSHVVKLYIPVTFEDFAIRFDDVTVNVGDSARKGNLTIRAKNNQFLILFRIAHNRRNCAVSLTKVRTLKYTNVDFDFELQGMPHLHLTNISNTVSNETWIEDDYEMVMLETVFDSYLSPEGNNINNNNALYGYCTYGTRPHIKRHNPTSNINPGGRPRFGHRKRNVRIHLNQRKVKAPIRHYPKI